MTDLQGTLITVRDCADMLKNSNRPAAQQSYRNLPPVINRIQTAMDGLVDFIQDKLLRKGKGLARLSLSERKKKHLTELRVVISEAQQNLQLILLSANLLVKCSGHAIFSDILTPPVAKPLHCCQPSRKR
jgi:hypothetical protein